MALGLGLLSAQVQAQDEAAVAADLLQRMSNALRTLDYQGSFVYQHGGEIDSLRLFHEGGSRERERLVGLNGPRSEILREGELIVCVQDGRPTTLFPSRVGSRLLPLVPDAYNRGFGTQYSLGLAGEDRVAGYRARIVEIRPRDAYRYGYRLWLEEDSNLPLRSAVVDPAQRVLEQFVFVTLDIHVKPKAGDLASAASAGAASAPDEVPLNSVPRWRVADPPPGFLFVRGQRPTQAPTSAEHYVYADGIANVSVYVEPRDTKQALPPDGALTRGLLNIYVHAEGDWKITVVGDVPRATVQRIARSVQPVASGSH